MLHRFKLPSHRPKRAIQILSALLVCCLLGGIWTPPSLASGSDWTVYAVRDQYQPAKFEPAKGAYLGAYVLQDEFIEASMTKFNELTQKKHMSFFKYVGYGRPFPTDWVEDVKAAGAVPHIAFEPNAGLDVIKDNEYLRKFARQANEAGVPIFLRFASEMNGTWTEYSGKSEQYVAKWRLVHRVFAQEAPNVAMVWTVFSFPESTMASFYPGDGYVDWVGVNIYNVVYHNDNRYDRGDNEDPLKLLDYVYNTYSGSKPIQISEYGATHYTITDKSYHVDFAQNKIKRLYDNLPSLYPRVKSIYYFDVNNVLNAPETRKINDYSITDNAQLLAAYRKTIKNPHYLTGIQETATKPRKETFSARGIHFESGNQLYTDVGFFSEQLGLKVTIKGRTATVSNGTRAKVFNLVKRRVSKGFNGEIRTLQGLPLRAVSDYFGYGFASDAKTKAIWITKK
ncbi:glycoside hydrolase family 26 protein [Cohnella nanjingensis]|uniref:Copper amine oxidase n=1 Tax=Cohnella nanjingensis TaxID=1387779 RepID=A0A7X0RRR2_9BACL|nr:glycosyl hydrolase [Cohnella nanjingensis]MBB6672335.1 copper amine oxidase [Cohnella nanjingensis]